MNKETEEYVDYTIQEAQRFLNTNDPARKKKIDDALNEGKRFLSRNWHLKYQAEDYIVEPNQTLYFDGEQYMVYDSDKECSLFPRLKKKRAAKMQIR